MTGKSFSEHRILGVADETRAECPESDTIHGPHPDAKQEFDYCPYCGEEATDDEHDRIRKGADVWCPDTNNATWRYCPNCGDNVGE